MKPAGWTILALARLLIAGPLAAQGITVEPERPLPGSLIRLTVSLPVPGATLHGELAGEPLHFHPLDSLHASALGAVPLEDRDTLVVTLALSSDELTDTLRYTVALATGDYPVERLSVAPRMAHPDSAARVRIAREIARAKEVSQASHGTPRQYDEPFQVPRESRITSRFGTGREFNGEVVSRHFGTDFDGKVGAPVHAANAGRVVLVGWFYLAGRVVYIDHGEGLISAYFHLSRALVKTGETVRRGQVIGEVGQTGRVTGPHLHWVMRYGGVSVDPLSVLALLGPAENGNPGPAN